MQHPLGPASLFRSPWAILGQRDFMKTVNKCTVSSSQQKKALWHWGLWHKLIGRRLQCECREQAFCRTDNNISTSDDSFLLHSVCTTTIKSTIRHSLSCMYTDGLDVALVWRTQCWCHSQHNTSQVYVLIWLPAVPFIISHFRSDKVLFYPHAHWYPWWSCLMAKGLEQFSWDLTPFWVGQWLLHMQKDGGLIFTCKDFGRLFDHSFPACAFFFFFF